MDTKLTAKMLIEDEGRERFAYKCTAGKLTIGVGRNIDKGGLGLSEDEIDLMLQNDIKRAVSGLSRHRFWKIANNERRAALVSMFHNLGEVGFLKFRNTIELMNKGDWEGASKAILKSKWATQVPNRVKRISDIFSRGSF